MVGAASPGDAAPSLEGPGNLFIRQKFSDLPAFKKIFLGQRSLLKAQGFSAYSLHRDLQDSHCLILTLKCSNLRKALAFVGSKDFKASMDQAGVRDTLLWKGLDVTGRKYAKGSIGKAGIVIASNQVRSFSFWKSCFDAEGGHQHPNRGYLPSRYSIHRWPGKPEVALVVHEASDVSKAPAFMASAPLKGVMEASGVTGLQVWYGINLEEGPL